MAEEYRFFNHIDGDRQYNADEFAEYFRQVLTNGILNGGTNLQVYCNGSDRVARIRPGKAWIEGYFYKLTDELELPLAEAHGTYDRIDRIVLRLDRRPEARHIRAFVLTGEPAMEPAAPELTRDGLVYEISLAQVLVVHNTSVLQPGNVTDERLDASVCGLVNSLVQVDAAHMTQQFEDWYDSKTAQWQQEWEDWFAGIQGQNYIPASEKGTPNGVATLDAEGKVPVDQLPAMDYVPISDVGAPGGVAKQDEFESHKAEEATISQLGHVQHAVLAATLDTNWSGSSPPFTKTVTVNGITASDVPIIDVVMSGTFATDEARLENWGNVYRAVTGNNSITFYATEKPEVTLPVQIKVVRS